MAQLSVRTTPVCAAPQQFKQDLFFRMVRLRRIARSRPDSAVVLVNQLLGVQFSRLIAPRDAGPVVQQLGTGLGETVGQRLDHDRAVGVVRRVQLGGEVVRTMDADDKAAEVIRVFSPATQSARATLGLPVSFLSCWRRVWKRHRSVLRDSSVQTMMSSPSALAGKNP